MSDPRPNPLLLGFVADLMFVSKIEQAASYLGFAVRWVENADQIAPASPDVPWRQPGEHLVGRGAALLAALVEWQPALIVVDLSNDQVPWRRWVPLIKSAPATRRFPVICFGSHVDVETMQAAKSAGADAVLARSRFASDLPGLIQKYAHIPDWEALESACAGPLSELAVRGLEEFNRGEYFESHELLEEAWNEDDSAARELYRAVLQVAVAYLQIERRNFRGAVKMFLRMRQWLDPLPETCRGIDVGQLRRDAEAVHQALLDLGPDRLAEFDRRLFKPVVYAL